MGTTLPKYFLISSGCSCKASEKEQNITPSLASFSLYVVATETLSKIASTATLVNRFCSFKGIPNLAKVSNKVGSTSSKLLSLAFFCFGAE